MTPNLDRVISLIEQLDARVVTVEVATQRFELDISELREALGAGLDTRVQKAVLAAFSHTDVQSAVATAFAKAIFTKKNLAVVASAITTIVTIIQQLGRLI